MLNRPKARVREYQWVDRADPVNPPMPEPMR